MLIVVLFYYKNRALFMKNDSVESLRERVQKLEGESFIEVINNWRSYE